MELNMTAMTLRRTLLNPIFPNDWIFGETDTYAWASKETPKYRVWIRYDYTNVPERTMYINTFGYDGPVEIDPGVYSGLLHMSTNFTLKARFAKEEEESNG